MVGESADAGQVYAVQTWVWCISSAELVTLVQRVGWWTDLDT